MVVDNGGDVKSLLGDAVVNDSDIDSEELVRLRTGEEAEGPDPRAVAKRDALLREMNKRHAFIANYGGKAVITDMQPDETDPRRQRITFVLPGEIKLRYSNQTVPPAYKKDKEGYKELGAWWLRHKDRCEYAGMRFLPGGSEVQWLQGKAYLNLWQGWGVEPKEGDWSLMREHIREVLADGDPLADLYIIRWLAWMVQHPDIQAEVALVLRGKKGCGKGTLTKVLLRIVGLHAKQVSDQEHMTGKFNDHLQDCVLLVADEAFWAGDKRAEGALKRMITEGTLMIEPKFVNSFAVPNRLHVIITGNDKWLVPASENERRFVVCVVSDDRIGDMDYFKALNAEIDGGGAAAMLHDLLRMELGDWHPRQIYINEALRQQQAHSLPGVAGFYERILQEGSIPGATVERPYRTRFKVLFKRAQQANRHIYRMSDRRFADELTELGIVAAVGTGNAACRDFPPLQEARRAFAARYHGWRWENDAEEWVVDGTQGWLEGLGD